MNLRLNRRSLLVLVALLAACAAPTPPASAPASGSAAPPPPAPAGAAGATQAPAATPSAQPIVHLNMATQHLSTDVATYVAKERGYFAEQGLDVELVDIATSQGSIPPLASGQL